MNGMMSIRRLPIELGLQVYQRYYWYCHLMIAITRPLEVPVFDNEDH